MNQTKNIKKTNNTTRPNDVVDQKDKYVKDTLVELYSLVEPENMPTNNSNSSKGERTSFATNFGETKKLTFKESIRRIVINPIFLLFNSKKLESEFVDFYYGKNYAVRLAIVSFIGSLMYSQFALSSDMGLLIWWTTDLVVGFMMIILGILFLIPAFVRRKLLLEFTLSFVNVIVTFRTGIHDVILEGISIPSTPIKVGVYYFELIYNILLRPRIIWLLPVCVINSITYITYTSICHYKTFEFDARLLFSNFSYVSNEFLIFCFVYFLNRSDRVLFRVNYLLQLKRVSIREERRRTDYLLRNILPINYISEIRHGDLEKKNNIIIKRIDMGAILECDIVGFTKWSSSTDAGKVTKVLNYNFSFWDTICDELKLTKVKTVGDAFISFSNSTDFRAEIILLGIGIIESVKYTNRVFNLNLNIRVGIAEGSFFTCVFGSIYHHLNFDVFGELYHQCVKMEETSPENHVNVNFQLYVNTMELFQYDILDCEKKMYVIDVGGGSNNTHKQKMLNEVIVDEQHCERLCSLICDCKVNSEETTINSEEEDDDDDKQFEFQKKKVSKIGLFGAKIVSNFNKSGFIKYIRQNKRNKRLQRSIFFKKIFNRRNLIHFFTKFFLYDRLDNINTTTTTRANITYLPLFLIFTSIFHEFKVIYRNCLKSSFQRVLICQFFLLLVHFQFLFYYICTSGPNEINLKILSSPHMFLIDGGVIVILTYCGIIIEIISICILLIVKIISSILLQLNRKINSIKINSIKISTTIIFFLIFFVTYYLFYKLFFLLCFFLLPNRVIRDTYGLLTIFDICLLLLDPFTHFFFKNLFILINLIHLIIVIQVHTLHLITTCQIFMILMIGFFVSQVIKEKNMKYSYMKEQSVKLDNKRLMEEKQKNENLIHSMLPKNVVDRMYCEDINGYKGFSIHLKRTFVCFMKLSDCQKKGNVFENDDNASVVLQFIAALFNSFDRNIYQINSDNSDNISEHSVAEKSSNPSSPLSQHHSNSNNNHHERGGYCSTIKKIQNIFLFITNEDLGEELSYINLIRIIQVIKSCILDFQRLINQSALKNNLELKIGVSFGGLESGVVGKTKFLYDIFGDTVNLSSRLCGISENCKISMSAESLDRIFFSTTNNEEEDLGIKDKFTVQKRGKFFLKGKGNVECVYVDTNDKKDVVGLEEEGRVGIVKEGDYENVEKLLNVNK